MKISYDKTVDALNVLIRAGKVAQTVEVAPEILLDLDREGRMLNLEVLGALEKIGRKNMSTVHVGNRSLALAN